MVLYNKVFLENLVLMAGIPETAEISHWLSSCAREMKGNLFSITGQLVCFNCLLFISSKIKVVLKYAYTLLMQCFPHFSCITIPRELVKNADCPPLEVMI